jgi:hypothetical protein
MEWKQNVSVTFGPQEPKVYRIDWPLYELSPAYRAAVVMRMQIERELEPLGREFEAVWDENIETLYQS